MSDPDLLTLIVKVTPREFKSSSLHLLQSETRAASGTLESPVQGINPEPAAVSDLPSA